MVQITEEIREAIAGDQLDPILYHLFDRSHVCLLITRHPIGDDAA